MFIELMMPSKYLNPCHPLLLPPCVSQNQGLFQWVGFSCQVAKVLELQLQHQSFQSIFRVDWLVWSPNCSRDTQESSPMTQFKSINSVVLCLLYSWTLTYTHEYWKTIAFTLQRLVGNVMSLLFNTQSRFVIAFLSRNKCLNFMAAVSVCSHFGALQKEETLLCQQSFV